MRLEIEPKQYKKILELVPILTVDVIIKYNDKYLLVKRNNEPLKGQYWVVGGRVLKDESVWEAVNRKVKEEVGLNIFDIKMVGIYEDSYATSAFDVPTHTTSIVFEAKTDDTKVFLDNQSSEIKLVDYLPDRFAHRLFVCNYES